MSTIASQITSLTIVYSTIYSGADQSKLQSSASLAFVRGIHQGPVNSPHKWPVTRKMFPFDDVIMMKHYDYETMKIALYATIQLYTLINISEQCGNATTFNFIWFQLILCFGILFVMWPDICSGGQEKYVIWIQLFYHYSCKWIDNAPDSYSCL